MTRSASVLRTLFTAFLFFALLSTSFILQAQSGTSQAEVSGEASVVIVDYLDGASELQYFVVDKISGHETRIFFNDKAHPAFKTGKHLKVLGRGRSDGKGINAENVLLLDEEANGGSSGGSVSAPVATPETRKVLTILVDFNDAYVDTGTSNGVSLQIATDRMFNETKNVAHFFDNASLTTLTIPDDLDNDGNQEVYGPYLIDDSYIGGDGSQCTASTWVTKASDAWVAANPGKNILDYRHRLLIVPNYWDWGNRHCGWGGIAQLGCGTWCWAIAADPQSILHGVIIHELGHNFSLHHASLDTNNDGINDSEYGDKSDQMGSSRNWMKFNPPHFEDKGWMDDVEYEIRDVVASSTVQSFDLIPVDEEAWDWPGLRALKIERSASSDYYVSFRQQTGDYNNVTSSYTNGLSLHYGTNGSTRSYFIRMIAPGETFTDNTANVSITATSQMTVIDGTNSVEVMGVEICDSACSQIPAPSNLSASAVAIDSIDLSWTDNSNEDNFSLQRSLDGSNWSTIASPLANAETYTDIGLATATLYYYRVRAQEGGLNSGYSNVANATTLAVPPSADFTYSADFTEVTFTDASSDSDGTVVAWSWNFDDGSSSSAQNPVHTFAAAGTYDVSLTVTDNHGADDSTVQSITVEAPLFTDFYASSESTVGGTLSGNLNACTANDGNVESITERESGGKPSNRHTWLEHRWTFNISAGATVTLHANVWSSGSSDDDTFDFEYQLNGSGSFQHLFNVSSTNSANLHSAVIPGTPSSVVIRVVDTDRTQGHRDKDTVFVDHLFIQVGNPSSDPPDGAPSGLNANAASSSQIDLDWTDGTSNETGFTVERSPDGDAPWVEIADLPAGSESYSNAGLDAETTYFYRVRAYNNFGVSGYTDNASATTGVAPAIELSANGRKVKGKHTIDLSWTSSSGSPMDIWEGGSLVQANVSGAAWTHSTSNKGAGTYVHQVCESGGTTSCSNETTTVY